MSTVEEIEAAVRRLPPNDLANFREWFGQYDVDAWDRQFEADVAGGQLDALAAEALRDLDADRCTDR